MAHSGGLSLGCCQKPHDHLGCVPTQGERGGAGAEFCLVSGCENIVMRVSVATPVNITFLLGGYL